MKKSISYAVNNVKWSQPMSVKGLSQIFDVHRNTMSKWLKDQVICNQQLSARRWRVATFEIPADLIPTEFERQISS
jgi:hypothetical protein